MFSIPSKLCSHCYKYLSSYLTILSILGVAALWLLTPEILFANNTPPPTADGPYLATRIILQILWVIVVNVFGTWVWLTGTLLNYSVSLYVIDFADQYIFTGVGFAVDRLWTLMRDLFNLTFIFGLVYLGLRMILNSDDSNTKKNLVMLILAALLVNFSLFFTKAIVDFTNITATQIVASIQSAGTVPTITLQNVQGNPTPVPDISGYIIEVMRLTNFWSAPIPEFSQSRSDMYFAYIIFTALFLLITGFVFISGGLMLIIRFVVLNFYLIFSPLIFLGWVFPNLQGVTSKYWRGFLGRAFFAPVYLFCIYIALTIMGAYVSATASFNPDNGMAMFASGQTIGSITERVLGVAIPFVVVSGFMIAALVISQKLGADGANLAVSVGNNLQRRGRRMLYRGATRVPRNVVNKSGARLNAGLTKLQTYKPSEGKYIGGVERGIQKIARGAAVDNAVRGTAKTMSSAKFGWQNTVADNTREAQQARSAIDARVAIADGLRAVNSPEEQTYQAIIKRQKELDEIKKAGGEDQVILADGITVKDRAAITADEQAALSAVMGDAAQKRQAVIAQMQSKVNDLSIKDIEAMGQADREAIAGLLTASQIESLMKSDNINAGDKKQIGIKRSNAFKSMVTEVLGNQEVVVSDRLQKLSAAQLEAIGIEFINKNAADLTDKQIDELSKSKNFTETQINQLKANRELKIKERFNSPTSQVALPYDPKKPGSAKIVNAAFYETTSASVNPVTGSLVANYTKKKKAEEIAKMPAAVLTDDKAIPNITSDVLNEIVKNKKLTIDERAELADKVIQKVTNQIAVVGGADKLDKQDRQLYRMLMNNPSQKMKDEFNLD